MDVAISIPVFWQAAIAFIFAVSMVSFICALAIIKDLEHVRRSTDKLVKDLTVPEETLPPTKTDAATYLLAARNLLVLLLVLAAALLIFYMVYDLTCGFSTAWVNGSEEAATINWNEFTVD